MTKKELRLLTKSKASSLGSDYKTKASEKISRLILSSSDFINASSVFIYMSTENEPDTNMITATALNLGKNVFVPLCIKKGEMKAVRITGDTVFTSGYMGIKEPSYGYTEEEAVFDLAIIPCVSAYTDGRRLGHGGGFYDIFLRDKKIKTYCLCFSELLSDNIPEEEHDIKMTAVVSEEGIFYSG